MDVYKVRIEVTYEEYCDGIIIRDVMLARQGEKPIKLESLQTLDKTDAYEIASGPGWQLMLTLDEGR